MSGKKDDCTYFEDEMVKLTPGMVPDTYSFKCPGGMCNPDKNNNKVVEEAPTVRQMPKTGKCPAPEPKPTVEQCVDPPKKQQEQTTPPITTQIPDTKNFKCEYVEPPKEEEVKNNNASKNDDSALKTCGASLSGGAMRNCKCGAPVPPIPKAKPCGCGNKGGANCGPNTACEVVPLTMSSNNSEKEQVVQLLLLNQTPSRGNPPMNSIINVPFMADDA